MLFQRRQKGSKDRALDFCNWLDKSLQFGPYFVKRYSRLSIKLSLDQARELNAIKVEETVDRDMIKLLHRAGRSIPGVSETEFIQIFEASSYPFC